MASPDYPGLAAGQRAYFLSGATRPTAWRVAQLNAVKAIQGKGTEPELEAAPEQNG